MQFRKVCKICLLPLTAVFLLTVVPCLVQAAPAQPEIVPAKSKSVKPAPTSTPSKPATLIIQSPGLPKTPAKPTVQHPPSVNGLSTEKQLVESGFCCDNGKVISATLGRCEKIRGSFSANRNEISKDCNATAVSGASKWNPPSTTWPHGTGM